MTDLTISAGTDLRSMEAERRLIVTIASSWLGTPYHHMGRIKGVGADCAMFPLEVYREAGLLPEFEIPFYPQDWHLHRSEELYLDIVERYAIENTEPPAVAGGALTNAPAAGYTPAGSAKPGAFVLYQFGRTWSHGAIVIEWPLIIHAVVQHGVILSDGEKEGMLVGRKRRFFSLLHPSATADGTDSRSSAATTPPANCRRAGTPATADGTDLYPSCAAS